VRLKHFHQQRTQEINENNAKHLLSTTMNPPHSISPHSTLSSASSSGGPSASNSPSSFPAHTPEFDASALSEAFSTTSMIKSESPQHMKLSYGRGESTADEADKQPMAMPVGLFGPEAMDLLIRWEQFSVNIHLNFEE
jgi:hypothetical protein